MGCNGEREREREEKKRKERKERKRTISASCYLLKKKSVTMHGKMNVKFVSAHNS